MNDQEILRSLGLPDNPKETWVSIAVLTADGTEGKFTVMISDFRIEPSYIELLVSDRQIDGISFDRLLCRIENGIPFGNWRALVMIPAKEEDDWAKSWEVLSFTPEPAAG